MRADAEVGRRNLSALELAEELAGLFFHLLFFILDEGHDVAEDVQRSDARVARAADGLHGGDEDRLDAKSLVERSEREGQAHYAAI